MQEFSVPTRAPKNSLKVSRRVPTWFHQGYYAIAIIGFSFQVEH